ncbi:hypothetical protein [Blastococcus sp. KM273129]|uniref:hypothetical protein n=1 Tax=Blastococcus sp. KM273129 TaxID=2570315 RepID=UPI001F45559B|nr:hypothetical protein [Blastococcus sp. KM273129]MCF6733714.1 hypothetical protein [Blastococcus sp. KM273129]
MEIYEFDGDRAETDLISHIITTEAPRLRADSGVVVCGRETALLERLAIALATAAGRTLVSHLPVACHTIYCNAITSGPPVVLLAVLTPARALTFTHNGGMADSDRPAGDRAVRTFIAGARYIHLARDNQLQCLRATTGELAEWAPKHLGDAS